MFDLVESIAFYDVQMKLINSRIKSIIFIIKSAKIQHIVS